MTAEITSTTTATTAPDTHIRIEVTETIVTTFVLTPEQLADYDVPTTLNELKALGEEDVDSLALTLTDMGQGYLTSFEVTKREALFDSVAVKNDDAVEETPSAK